MGELMEIAPEKISEFENRIKENVVNKIPAEINNDIELIISNNLLEEARKYTKDVETFFEPAIKSAHQTHKFLTSQKNKTLSLALEATRTIRRMIGEYQMKKQEEADAKRREAEEKARQEEDTKKAEIEAKIEEKREVMDDADSLGEIIELSEEINELEDKKESVDIKPDPLPVKKNIVRMTYDYVPTVVDKDRVPECFKIVDMAKLKKHGKLYKERAEVPGVKFTKTPRPF